ncbi:MAG: type II secretion system F family protein [Reichenbachiella sp.]|uniref:type II secretion system F family protein n=1 Tax=Reichenbachiella sp. TaxID=2184521 RepID=UPI003262D55C
MKISTLKQQTRQAQPTNPKSETSFWNKDISFKSKFANKEKAAFYQQLHVLIEAGVDIDSALGHLIAQTPLKQTKELIVELRTSLQKGSSIHEAMDKTKKFSNYEIYSIKIGEGSGRLLEVLENLAEYFEEKIAQRRDVISAISYPILIINAAIGAVFFMIFFIIPVFEGVFSRFGGELPFLTRKVIDISLFFRENISILFVILLPLIFALKRLLKGDKFYGLSEGVWLKIPIIGTFAYQSVMAKFANSMSLLLGAKVPLASALEMNISMFRSPVLKSTIQKSIGDLIKGRTYSESIEKSSFFDNNFKTFIKIGEESSRMEFFFKKLSKDYRTAMKHQTAILNTVLEPILIIVLGAIVGVILISMYLPMFEISTQMSFPE